MYDEYELSPLSPKMTKEHSSSWSKNDDKNQAILSQIEHYASQSKLGEGGGGGEEGGYDAVCYDEFYDGEYDLDADVDAGDETGGGEGNSESEEKPGSTPEDFMVLHRDFSLGTVSDYEISKVSFEGAALYDREGTALALNSVGRCLYLLALANPSREIEFLDLSLDWYGAGAKLAGFQDDKEEEKGGHEKKGAVRRSSHHLSITSRVGDGLQSALYHAECLIRRCQNSTEMKRRKLDVEAAFNIASGVKSFLNVQGHSRSSESYERLHNRTNEVLIAAEAARAGLVTVEVSFGGRRDLKTGKGDQAVVVGGGGDNADDYLMLVYESGSARVFKHYLDSTMFVADKTKDLRKKVGGGAILEGVGVAALWTKCRNLLFVDCVSLESVGEVEVGFEGKLVVARCEDIPSNAGGFFGTVDFLVVLEGDGGNKAVSGALRVATEKDQVFVLGLGGAVSVKDGRGGEGVLTSLAKKDMVWVGTRVRLGESVVVEDHGSGGGDMLEINCDARDALLVDEGGECRARGEQDGVYEYLTPSQSSSRTALGSWRLLASTAKPFNAGRMA